MRVYGPYVRKEDKRKIVILVDKNGKRTTKLYGRYLYEQTYGGIEKGLTIDHIDGDVTNDSLDNLQVLSLEDNIRKSKKTTKFFYFKCPTCLKDSKVLYRRYKSNQLKQNKSGPFCSKKCSGKNNASLVQRKRHLV